MRYYLQKIAIRAGDDEQMINYEWPEVIYQKYEFFLQILETITR